MDEPLRRKLIAARIGEITEHHVHKARARRGRLPDDDGWAGRSLVAVGQFSGTVSPANTVGFSAF